MAPMDERGMRKERQARGDDTERSLAPGTQIRHYKITGTLRSGGAGRIYLALDLASGERVAIKRPLRPLRRGKVTPGDGGGAVPAAAPQASEEARILQQVRHPNVVRLKEILEDEGVDYLVLEYVEGLDLETFLDKTGPGLGEAALRALLLPIARGVHALHRLGYLHRDLKPANIRIRHSGEPVLIDFGAAAAMQPERPGRSAWSTLTDGYAAPELYSDDLPEGPWSDVYGLAAIAYRAIAGSPPPPAPDLLAGLKRPPAGTIGHGRYSAGFLAAIDAGLALTAAARPASADLWAESIAVVQSQEQGPTSRTPVTQGDDKGAVGAKAKMDEDSKSETKSAGGEPTPAPARPSSPPSEADPFPPTVQVRRKPMARVRPTAREAVLPQSRPAKARAAPWGMLLVLVLLLAGLGGAGAYLGWPYYLRYIKEIWVVDPDGKGDVRTIMEALTQAKAGATVKVVPALYDESLVITRPVRLVSSGPLGTPPVIAPSKGRCLLFTAAAGEITGLAFQGPPSPDPPPEGQSAIPGAPAQALPCLDIAQGSLVLKSSEVTNPSGPGIVVRDGAAPELRKTVVLDTAGHGIVVASGAAGSIADSTVLRSGGAGIVVLGGAAPEITGTTIAESRAAGAVFAQGAKGSFVGNAVAASAHSGIEIFGGAAPEIKGNTIAESGQAGIYLHDFGQARIESNEVAASGFSGLLADSGARIEVSGNEIKGSAEHGVLLLDGSSARLRENVIVENTGFGIGVERGVEVELSDNTVEDNKDPQILRDGEAKAKPPPKAEASGSEEKEKETSP